MGLSDKPDLSGWGPRELIQRVCALPRDVFLRTAESPFFLVIVIDDVRSELAQGLATVTERPEGDGLAFRTAADYLDAAQTGEVGALLRQGQQGLEGARPGGSIPPQLVGALCFVAPISKRSEVSFLSHVSVGRARHHDIVLRHQSISKFHAWFEVAGPASLLLKDCNSRNHTHLNGKILLDRGQVCSGDQIKFGAVECFVFSASDLWWMITTNLKA